MVIHKDGTNAPAVIKLAIAKYSYIEIYIVYTPNTVTWQEIKS